MKFKKLFISLTGIIPATGIIGSNQLNLHGNNIYQVDPEQVYIRNNNVNYFSVSYHSTKILNQYVASVYPSDADQSVTWSLIPSNIVSDPDKYMFPNGMFAIDDEGYFSCNNYEPNMKTGYEEYYMYKFRIAVSSKVNPSIQSSMNMTIFPFSEEPEIGNIIISKDSGEAILNDIVIDQVYNTTSSFSLDCEVTNEEELFPNPKKEWSLIEEPSGVSISGSTLLINSQSVVTNQEIKVKCLVNDEIAARSSSKEWTLLLNVNYAAPIFDDITLQGTGVVDNNNINLSLNQATTINASCNITNPNNIDPSLSKSWAIQNQPDGVTINATTGQISIANNLAIGNYTFTLIYQCGSYNKQSTINLNIAYDTPQLGNITLTGDGVSDNNINLTYNQSANISASCSITNEDNIDPSLTKTWSLNNAPSGVSINSNGQLTIPTTQTLNNASFNIVYQVGTVRQTLSVTLTINYANPVLGEITLTKASGDAMINANVINQTLGTTSTFNAACNINNNANIDPSLPKTWSINNTPSGVSIDGSSGLMTINNPSYGNNQTINVTYTVGNVSKNTTYVLNVAYASPIFGEISLQGTGVIDNSHINLLANQSSTVTASCEVTNQTNTDPSFSKTWSLKNQPSGVSINSTTGVITIPDTLAINSYDLSIVCRYGTSTKESIVNLSIGYEMPILSNITLSSANNVIIQGSNVSIDYHTSGSFQATCDVTNQPNINPTLTKTWSLVNASSAITINHDGIVNITNDAPKMTNQPTIINCNVGGINETLTFYLTISEKPNDAHKDNTYIIIWSSVAAAILLCVIVSMSIIIRKKISKNS